MRRRTVLVSVLASLVAVVLLAACATPGGGGGGGQQQEKIGAVSVMGVWGGTELSSFQTVVKGWEQQTGGKMNFEGTRDLSTVLHARVAGGNPPDIAILPNPALLRQFAEAGNLQPLDGAIDMNKLKTDYSSSWIDLGSVNGKLYGVFVRASTKNTVWYSPKQFSASSLTTPATFADIQKLTNDIKSKGNVAPWSIGLEAGGASGWPGSDWIQHFVLVEAGPDVYDKWVAHEIPWTDPAIKTAFQRFGQFALTQGNVPGGAATIVSTNFQDSTFLPFEQPPKADMVFLGAFTQGFIAQQFPNLKPITDYDYFPFPAIDSRYQGAQTVGGDVVVMLKDTPSARSLMQYLANGQSWESWAKAGGFSTPNKSLPASAYPDPLSQKLAAQLSAPGVLRYDADDMMPAQVQNAEWAGILNYVQNPGNLDSILAQLESTAKDAYAAQKQQQSQPSTSTTGSAPASGSAPTTP